MAILPLIETIASPLTAGINAISQNKANKANAKLTKEMFNMTNAYNAPIQQVKRMKEAGLNPALMYQGSPQNTSQLPSTPRQEAYKIPESLMADTAQKLASARLSAANTPAVQVNIDNKRAGTELLQEQTETQRVLQGKMAQEIDKLNIDNRLNSKLFETNRQFRTEQLHNIQQANMKLEKELEYMTPTQKQTLANLQASYDQTVRQTKKLDNENWIMENNQKLQAAGVNPNGNNMVDTVLRFIIQNGSRLLSTE